MNFKLIMEPEASLYRNVVDGLFAIIVMILIPFFSIWLVAHENTTVWVSYGFPLVSISAAALYDCYGRYGEAQGGSKHHSIKRLKIIFRSFLHGASVLTACFICGNPSVKVMWWVPLVFLLISAVMLIVDCFWLARNWVNVMFGK